MWRNPFYCGVQTNKFLDGEVIKDNWKSMVSINDFKAINQRFDDSANVDVNNLNTPLEDRYNRNYVAVTVALK